ncbi:MAG: ribonuclease HI family protein [Candidatus Omnitrophica bacterium]|nr:ribonuclease HI family protein [Candidatus Omnitrophota bacterium]
MPPPHKRIRIYSDGGARGNPGPAAIGVLICDPQGEYLQDHNEVIGTATNNIAEYTAIIVGLELAKKLGAEEIEYFLDSELVANQLSGCYRIKTPHLRTLFNKVKASEKFFKKVLFTHLPRTHEKIRYVDKLVNQALDGEA